MSCKNPPPKPTDVLQKAKSTELIVEYLECCIQLKDQYLIADLVLNADTWMKRRAALDFLTEKTLLQKVVKESQDKTVYYAAENRLRNLQQGISLATYKKIGFIIGAGGEITVDEDGIIKGAKEYPTATFKEALVMGVP